MFRITREGELKDVGSHPIGNTADWALWLIKANGDQVESIRDLARLMVEDLDGVWLASMSGNNEMVNARFAIRNLLSKALITGAGGDNGTTK